MGMRHFLQVSGLRLTVAIFKSCRSAPAVRHACLWQNVTATARDLNSLNSSGATKLDLLDAYQINSKGGIIGYFHTNGARAFLLTPR